MTATPTATPSCPSTSCTDATSLIVALHEANRFEIGAGRLALVRSRDADIRQMARDVVRDHAWLDADLRLEAGDLGLALTNTLTADQQATLRDLRHLRGLAFDNEWVDAQIVAHDDALAMIDDFVTTGCDQGILDLVEESRVVVAYHLWVLEQM
jgi:predicted outer membrane protein